MPAKSYSLKQLKIDKDNSTIVGVTSAAVFIIIFCLISCRSLFSQMGYNNRLATAQQTAVNQLKTDVRDKNELYGSYEKFVSPSTNIIGGSSTGSGPNDGNNAQIVLDALPSKYDFPALATSLQALLSREAVTIDGVGGTDQQVQYESNVSPIPVAIPVSFSVDGPYQSIENIISDVQKSIRPMQIQTITLSGSESDMQLTVSAQTYYQPEDTFTITHETIR